MSPARARIHHTKARIRPFAPDSIKPQRSGCAVACALAPVGLAEGEVAGRSGVFFSTLAVVTFRRAYARAGLYDPSRGDRISAGLANRADDRRAGAGPKSHTGSRLFLGHSSLWILAGIGQGGAGPLGIMAGIVTRDAFTPCFFVDIYRASLIDALSPFGPPARALASINCRPWCRDPLTGRCGFALHVIFADVSLTRLVLCRVWDSFPSGRPGGADSNWPAADLRLHWPLPGLFWL